MKKNSAPPEESLGFWIYRTYSQANNLLRRTFQAKGYDLTPEQWGVLRRLRQQEGMNQSQLGESMFKDRHNITRLLNLLEKRGFIERRADETDKRIYRVFLTEAGREEEKKAGTIVKSHRETLFGNLGAEDVAAMQRILEHIVGNIERKGQRP
jgi:DNA-binding MarR family transcriptional regulator